MVWLLESGWNGWRQFSERSMFAGGRLVKSFVLNRLIVISYSLSNFPLMQALAWRLRAQSDSGFIGTGK
jgi:hypothetical protein